MTMVKSLFAFILIVLTSCASLTAQEPTIRRISDGYQSDGSVPQKSSLRIEEGKVWVNGNLVPVKALPKGLRNIDPAIQYQSASFGMGEIAFNLYGTNYVVKDDRVVELQAKPSVNAVPPSERPSTKAMEEYYSNLKRDSPGLFYSLGREAALTETARQLTQEYNLTSGKEKEKVKDELRVILGQLFDINEHNRGKEVLELQMMIDAAQREIQMRRANKGLIIDNTIKEMLKD